MKKHSFLALLILCLAGCSGSTYKGYDPPEEEENTDPVPVLIALGKPNYSVTTKGSGAVTGEDNDPVWSKAKVYIYSFLKGENTDFTAPMEEAISGDRIIIPQCLIDASMDTPGSQLGKEAQVIMPTQSIKWTGTGRNSTVYFPSSKDPYEFYGYYIDNIVPTDIQRTTNSISFGIEIDGTQDVMSAVAELSEEQKSKLSGTADEQNVLNSLYSSYTARRDYQPVMKFKHHLVRLRFEIYAGKEAADDVYVNNILIDSKVEGRFTVADKNKENIGIVFDDTRPATTLYLKDKDGAELADDYNVKYQAAESNKSVFERTPVLVGESMLVAPAQSYNFTIGLEQDFGGERVPYITTDVLKLAGDANFQAGKEYVVRIAIYGIEEIKINVLPEGWLPGGNIDIDPDENF